MFLRKGPTSAITTCRLFRGKTAVQKYSMFNFTLTKVEGSPKPPCIRKFGKPSRILKKLTLHIPHNSHPGNSGSKFVA